MTDVTLAGAGEGQTTLTMTGDPYGAVGRSTSIQRTGRCRNSNIFGWMVGVYYSTSSGEACTVLVSTDCNGFDDNQDNVFREMCNPPTCDGQEECP